MPTADSLERMALAKAAKAAPAPGSFMDTAGYNSGHVATKTTNTSGLTYQDIRDAQGTTQQQAVQDAYNGIVVQAKPAATVENNNSNNGGGGSSATIPTSAVKVATPDIITINQETLPQELMTSLIFENIGGQELISTSRHDLITGSNMDYQSIKNLSEIYLNHNPMNIIPMPDSASVYENNFPINWDSHIVENFSSTDSSHIYIDLESKQLQLLVTNIKSGEQVEVEVLSSVTGYNYTKF